MYRGRGGLDVLCQGEKLPVRLLCDVCLSNITPKSDLQYSKKALHTEAIHLQAHSIVNLCLANTKATSSHHTKLQRKRYEIEEAFYKMTQMTHPLSFDQVNEAAQKHKRKLEAARQQIRKEINELDSLIPKLQQEGKILSRKNRETLGKFNKAAAKFSKFCTTKLQSVSVSTQ